MKRTRVKSRSSKAAALGPKRRAFVAEQLDARPMCEAGKLIRGAHGSSCTVRATVIHEPLLRSRGGSTIDVDNSVAICDPCHRWVHDHPMLATELGLMRSAQ